MSANNPFGGMPPGVPPGMGLPPGVGMPGLNVGGPKTLKDIKPLDTEGVKQFIDGCEGFLTQGAPLEVPAAVALGDLCRIALSLQNAIEDAEFLGKKLQEAEVKIAQLQGPYTGPGLAPLPRLEGLPPLPDIPSFLAQEPPADEE